MGANRRVGQPELPTGTVTFVLTDIEGSARLWEGEPRAMRRALACHDEVVEQVFQEHGGIVLKRQGEGDSAFAVFARASDALMAAGEAQRSLVTQPWPDGLVLRVRMAVHTGEAELRDGDYFGTPVNRAARLREMGHGGQVLCSQTTAELLDGAPAGFELVDLGEHRLRDLARPERVLQLSHPELRNEFPPLRSLEVLPNNLPIQLTSFVGRVREMTELAVLLGEHRLLTLTGAAGSGKTRLALHVAAQVVPDYPGGVWLIDLGGLTDAGAIEETVASTLGIFLQPGETLAETVLSFLRNKRMLLLLDNCEHMLDAVTRIVESILGNAPTVSLLATSREPLGVRGERVVGLPSLAVPGQTASVDALAATDAVELFVDRARAARSDFALTAENAEAVAQLCRRLDGIPLAIELAAARVRSMTPRDIAGRLDQLFRLLTGGARSATNRHQTLRRAIDWSYDLLDTAERDLLVGLSVCVSGFDLAAAEAIGASGAVDPLDIDDLLSRLVDKSLVTAEDRGGAMRYRLLETIRTYAFEKLEETGAVDVTRRRHAEHYADFASTAGLGLKSRSEHEWLLRVEDELDNLRAAVTWSLEAGESEAALTIVTALALTGLRIEPVVGTWAAAVASSAATDGDPRLAAALAFLAWTRLREGQTEEASRIGEEALRILDLETQDHALACCVLAAVTGVQASIGRSPLERARQWLAAARLAGDLYQESLASSMLAVAQSANGVDDARATAAAGLGVARGLGAPSAIAYCSFTTALVTLGNDPAQGAALLDESVLNAELASNDYALVIATAVRSSLLSQAGDHLGAASAFLDSVRRAFEYGHRSQQAFNLWCLAGSLAVLGSLEPAAVIMGWVSTVLTVTGTISEGPLAIVTLNLHPDTLAALTELPNALGTRHTSLTTVGATMTDEEVIQFAEDALGKSRPQEESPPTHSSQSNIFQCDGDSWSVTFAGHTCRMKDSKGLRYIARLLTQPGREIHVLDLAGTDVPLTAGTGPIIDDRAANAYKQRIADLEAEIAEATAWADVDRADKARAEMDALTHQLAAAYGLSGRARNEADPTERIRKAVTNRIRDSLGRFDTMHPPLGRHLRNAVRTGVFCSYVPEHAIHWEVGHQPVVRLTLG